MNDCIKIEFFGFEPRPRLQAIAREIAERVSWKSPSDSSVKIDIIKSPGLYQATARICSSVAVFAAEAKSQSAPAALKLLETNTMRQLQQWKVNRCLQQQRFMAEPQKQVS